MNLKRALYGCLFLLIFIALLSALIFAQNTYHNERNSAFPEFDFDKWGEAPSAKVRVLISERAVQKILFSTNEIPLLAKEIAKKIGETEILVTKKLGELQSFDLVQETEGKWISNIPLYAERAIREIEKLGLKYAKNEAEILRAAIPKFKKLFQETNLSRHFSWDAVSLIIVGAFLADFCVIDRIPFRPENFTEKLQPRLKKSDGTRWELTGFERLPKRYPSLKWKFYQNFEGTRAKGISRFGYYIPDEQRMTPPSGPEYLALNERGTVLCALADNPLSQKELEAKSGLGTDILLETLAELSRYNPPAVILKAGKYYPTIPIFSESDFKLFLSELDKIAEDIFKNVVLFHAEEREAKGKELGSRWPLPADPYVRDKALQILVEQGLLTRVPSPPVPWNFGVWGWNGFLRIHGQITEK